MNKFLVCFLLFSSAACAAEPDQTLHEKCLYPTIQLIMKKSNGENCGTGVIVRSIKRDGSDVYSNVVLTATHNLTAPPMLRVPKFKDKNVSKVTSYDEFDCAVFESSEKFDMAIILFESPEQMPVAELDFAAEFFIGSKIFKFGYGLKDESRLDRGEITSISTDTPPGFEGRLRFNAYTVFGDSGGPLFSDDYKLIGINTSIRIWQSKPFFDFGYAMPIATLKIWNTELQDNKIAFVYDNSAIPLSVLELKKKNALQELNSQLLDVKQEIEIGEKTLELKRKVEESIHAEIKRVEEGKELPVPQIPEFPAPIFEIPIPHVPFPLP